MNRSKQLMLMNKLIIAEKPSVALRIAMSLGDGKPRTNYVSGVRYYEVSDGSDMLYIVAAAGHLFTIRERGKGDIPVFDVEWVESFKVNTSSYFTKKYLDTIASVGRKCAFFINACDYDIEGTVIGSNIIKYVVNGNVNSELRTDSAKRMRFSTTTRSDLIDSYKGLNDFDLLNFYAGETRHKIDWLWGINMSRALMRAISSAGIRKVLSIGRVQGPALSILAEREKSIKSFKPQPYWKVVMFVKGVRFENKRDKIFEKSEAEQALEKTKKGTVVLKGFDSKDRSVRPFPPFDLTSLQLEANRTFGIDPSRTLALAQSLYERSYISYPRTSSQKLPATLNLPRIIKALAANPRYKEHAEKLISASRFRPAEGFKEDEAHPSIYPTGESPLKLTDEEAKLYDLIARRFLACFAEYAVFESTNVSLDVDGEQYSASGERIKKPEWLDFYTYYKPKVADIPVFASNEKLVQDKTDMKELVTEPPKRFSKASLIALLEDKELGTKATRAEIIDTLFKREYIKGAALQVTEFGMSIYDALSMYCASLLDEKFTRKLEDDMNSITKGTMAKETVIDEGKSMITEIIADFKKNEKQIGDELAKGLKESEVSSRIGVCNRCGGNLVLRRSKTGKSFIGCSNWPSCNNTYSVPQYARIVPTGKVCEICKTPKIKVFRKGKVFEMDLDPNCPTKQDWAKKEEAQNEKAQLDVKKASELKAKEPVKEKTVEEAPAKAKKPRKRAARKPKKSE
ncbi:MAG: DNA topoisomerase I [Candidatus Micrarchaeota archaeon]|nr:DNA topoisomerase I [Candidatus Micrarchaeota archaeon]